MSAPEKVADFILTQLAPDRRHPYLQGKRTPPLAHDLPGPALRTIAENRLRAFGELEARALIGWAVGTRDGVLFDRLLEPREVVALQALGRRCVSLVDLEIALHDLRHLEKFFDPLHHRQQIGFFRLFNRPMTALDEQLDQIWCNERDAVLSDMNGSPIFLFAVLKMKLKVAARRKLARERGTVPQDRGALSEEELAVYAPVLEQLLDLMGLDGEVRESAREISARRDHPRHAQRFVTFLERV